MIEKNQFYSNDHPARAIDNRYTLKDYPSLPADVLWGSFVTHSFLCLYYHFLKIIFWQYQLKDTLEVSFIRVTESFAGQTGGSRNQDS